MRLAHPEIVKTKFIFTDFVKHLLTDEKVTNELLKNFDYSKVNSSVYREVLKRKSLWKVGEQVFKFNTQKFDQFYAFIERTLAFLRIREDRELFRNMNEFYSVIMK